MTRARAHTHTQVHQCHLMRDHRQELLTDVRTLFRTPLFVMSTASYALYTWVLGVLSVQGPKAEVCTC